MSRITLALFLLFVLVVVQIEAQKCRRYETICYPKGGCRTRCIRRGRRDVSEALERSKRLAEEEKAARDLDEMARRFEEDVNEDEEKRHADDDDDDDDQQTRFVDDEDLDEEVRGIEEEEARHVDDDDDNDNEEEARYNNDNVDEEEMEVRSLYDDFEEE